MERRMQGEVLRPMLSPARRSTLGSMYSLVGTHSAVKLCRWQKSMMRNRGGCYKWTMYGIASHRCIEATPSMACANNCVFCWRHNTNPTATAWRWQTDAPNVVLDGILASHRALVNEVRGMPGVTETTLREALEPRHCALSLVGEPILYPYVNAFLGLLHTRRISTFLVNNGQFPSELRKVAPVTQLYLSVDATNRSAMKLLDRPIFTDFWERFSESVDVMRDRKERTVFRVTLIEGYNMGSCNLPEYVELVKRGRPNFIELKRLTPAFMCNSILRIRNVPSWSKMKDFARCLCSAISCVVDECDAYVVASVHEHSGCILLAQQCFCIYGKMHTWIDFNAFLRLVQDPQRAKDIAPTCYMLPTPSWALPDAPGEGFDPRQERHYTTKRRKHMATEQALSQASAVTLGALSLTP